MMRHQMKESTLTRLWLVMCGIMCTLTTVKRPGLLPS